jgi:hypothetical protein
MACTIACPKIFHRIVLTYPYGSHGHLQQQSRKLETGSGKYVR